MSRPGGTRATVQVTTAAAARAHARSVVREQWEAVYGTAREQDLIDLLLVVSELVTNAIRHGDGLAGFEVAPDRDGLRISVRDNSDLVPETAYGSGALPVVHEGNGYGWPLIIRLARNISIERRPTGGKTISMLVPLSAEDRHTAPGAEQPA